MTVTRRCFGLLHAVFLWAALTAPAAPALNPLFGDGMVVQQEMRVPVWGTADPGEKVTLTFAEQTQEAVADERGQWKVWLEPMPASTEPRVLRVASSAPGGAEAVVSGVLVGEVWLCGGQSNMAYPMPRKANAEAIAEADLPMLRLFTVRRVLADTPLPSVSGRWAACTPKTVSSFSATGYWFGHELVARREVPVGLICSAWGGTCVEAWTSPRALESTPELQRLRDAQSARKRGNHNEPSVLYNAMIAPLGQFAVRGVIWYQGERNAWRDNAGADYRLLFPALIHDWREQWKPQRLPFLFVQLPNWTPVEQDPNAESKWGEIREAQAAALRLPDTAMAVMIDSGDTADIHPPNKQPFGHRLALAAQAVAYGEDVVYHSPMYREIKREGKRIRILFDYADGPLVVRGGEKLKWFAVAGDDRRFVWAEAELDGTSVLVWSDEVPDPVAVRYAWWMNPLAVNLYIVAGLPVAPFRTDDW